MRVVLRFTVGLMMGLFVLGISNAQNVEGFPSHKGRFNKAKPLSCGDKITSHAVLYSDLDCSDYSGGAALTLGEGASLNLNRKKVIGNYDINCIEITEDGAKVWNGIVTHCDNGIRVRSNRNKITDVKVSDSASRGIRIDKDENLLIKCLAAHSASQGIVIKGNDNKIFSCKVHDNCRDGIEIDEGAEGNLVFNNHVEDNGNPETCAYFPEEEYKPWNYAGIDVLAGSKNNKIKHNRAGCNLGCVGSDAFPCTAQERDFWDENVDDYGNCDSTNEWESNSIVCNNAVPECSPSPP